ncbi:hypothetical protein [Actinomadura sp. 7K534]|uniref:hypothetical protein n=1 Tax=Actinomadura sp. 7K534 TaxID=2530366 RepID=UPI001FB5DB66|nr:hypothetical protein [Actinomadura sp. 7K534]
MLGRTLFSAGGDRMRDIPGQVTVRWTPDVKALLGVDLEPTPGLLQHLQDIPLGHALLHTPREHLRGAFPVEVDRLVGRPQRDAELLQGVLDLCSDVGPARDSVDGLTDHHIEPSIGLGSFQQQVLDAAVPRNRDVEPLVSAPESTCVEILASGFDVVEVRDDDGLARYRGVQRGLAVGELPRERQGRILLVLGRGPSREGHPQRPVQPKPAAGAGQSCGPAAVGPSGEHIEWDRAA